jgi:hypothetical protein
MCPAGVLSWAGGSKSDNSALIDAKFENMRFLRWLGI